MKHRNQLLRYGLSVTSKQSKKNPNYISNFAPHCMSKYNLRKSLS